MGKYVTRQPKYINGQYINASGTEPKVIEVDLPAGADPRHHGLEHYKGSEPEAQKLAPHFHATTQPHVETAEQVHSKAVEENVKHDEKHKGSKGRASDKDIA